MESSLSTQLLTVHENHCLQIDSLLRNYTFDIALNETDDFLLVVRNRFFWGVHSAFQESILQVLSAELGPQQEIAEALGLKDRTSISKMIKSGTMDGTRITAAFYLYPDLLKKLPTRERAALYGFARATSFIKALVYDDMTIEGAMKPQDFSYLVGVLASSEWNRAILDPNHDVVRKLAKQIILERTISTVEPVLDARNREEQCVLKLQELKLAWGDFAVIALWAIPECIPEDSVNEGRIM
jgi:hypothetical protein